MSKETTSTEETKKGLVPYSKRELKQITRDVFCKYLADVKNLPAMPIEKPCENYPDIKFPIKPMNGNSLKGYEMVYPIEGTSETIVAYTGKVIDYRSQLIPTGDGNYNFDPATVDTTTTLTRRAEDGSEQELLFLNNCNLIMFEGEEPSNLAIFCRDTHTEKVSYEDGSIRYIAYDNSTCKDKSNPAFVKKEVFDAYEARQPVTVQESIDLHNTMVSTMVVTPEMILPTAQTPDPCM